MLSSEYFAPSSSQCWLYMIHSLHDRSHSHIMPWIWPHSCIFSRKEKFGHSMSLYLYTSRYQTLKGLFIFFHKNAKVNNSHPPHSQSLLYLPPQASVFLHPCSPVQQSWGLKTAVLLFPQGCRDRSEPFLLVSVVKCQSQPIKIAMICPSTCRKRRTACFF